MIGRGRFITRGSIDELTASAQGTVLVRAADLDRLSRVLRDEGAAIEATNDEGLRVSGLSAERIGRLAFDHGVALFELTPERASLEDVFMSLTAEAVEYGARPA